MMRARSMLASGARGGRTRPAADADGAVELPCDIAQLHRMFGFSRDHNEVMGGRKAFLGISEILADKTFDPIAHNRVAHLAADRYPDTAMPDLVPGKINDEVRRCAPVSHRGSAPKFTSLEKTLFLAKLPVALSAARAGFIPPGSITSW